MFSFGVILFIVVHGIFPFKEARTTEYFYNLLVTGQHDLYFSKVKGQHLSAEFKDLILQLLSYDASKRPSASQVRQHPWYAKHYSANRCDQTRRRLANDYLTKK